MSMWRSVKLLMPARRGCEAVSGRMAQSESHSFGGEKDGLFELIGSNALNSLAEFSRPCTVQCFYSLKPRQGKLTAEISLNFYELSKSANESETRTRRSEKNRDKRSRRLLISTLISFWALVLPKHR